MKKPKLKNFIFKKGLKSYFTHLKKYGKQEKLKEAQEIINEEHNLQQNLNITPKYREYAKVIKVKTDGTIIYQIKKRYFRNQSKKRTHHHHFHIKLPLHSTQSLTNSLQSNLSNFSFII